MSESIDPELARFVELVHDAVVVSCGEAVVACNERACTLFGYQRGELVGLPRAALIPDADLRLRDGIEIRRATGAFHGPVAMRRRDGTLVEVELRSTTLRGTGGEELVCAVLRDLTDARAAAEATAALRASESTLRALSDAVFEAVLVHRDGVVLRANRTAEEVVGVGPGGLVGKNLFAFIAPESAGTVAARMARLDERPYRAFGRRADGTTFPCEVRVRLTQVDVGGTGARVVVVRDLTEREAREAEVRQHQKLEALGRLAGEVAHDFNNLLSVILTATSLAMESLPADGSVAQDLADAVAAAERAASLTRQLLAFSRKQPLRVEPIDLDQLLSDAASMLRRLGGSGVALDVVGGSAGWTVQADPVQIEVLLMNLVGNARDALPAGGRVTIRTAFEELDDDFVAAHSGSHPGPHVVLSVTDEGVGMDAETLQRAFEPFFTTKDPGRGTGLGLSTVFGITRQFGGIVLADSRPGVGTTVRVYLPATTAPAAFRRPRGPVVSDARGTLLLVDDEPLVRRIAAEAVRRAGLTVLEAGSGPEAFTVAAVHRVDLLVTDVRMPGMSGPQLAAGLRAHHPALRVLYVTAAAEGSFPGDAPVLPKPFTPAALVAAVREQLGVAPVSGG